MKSRNYNIVKWIINVMLSISIVIVALYPFHNRSIMVVIDTSLGEKTAIFTPEELVDNQNVSIEYPDFNISDLKEVRIYRYFKTICIDKITSDKFGGLADIENGYIFFRENAVKQLKEDCQTLFAERIILAEVCFIFFLIFRIALGAISERLDIRNINNHGPIKETKRFIGDIKKYWQYMVFAARADLTAEVANSYLNRLWWILEPLFSMFVYIIVFGKAMGKSVENFAVFIFSGLMIWQFFSHILVYSVKCVRNNKDIVTKVYVPKHVIIISNIFLNMFKFSFSFSVLVPMLIFFRVHVGLRVFWMIPAYIVIVLLSFSCGMILLHYGVYVDDLHYAVSILLQMLMFLSGIFYDIDVALPKPLNNIMMCVNPVAMTMNTMRNAMLYNRISNVPLIVVWFVISILLMYVGVHIVYKNENGYVKVV